MHGVPSFCFSKQHISSTFSSLALVCYWVCTQAVHCLAVTGGGGQFCNSVVSIYHYIGPFCFVNYVPHIKLYLQVVECQCTTGLSSVVHCWTECLKGMVLDEWSVKASKLVLFSIALIVAPS